MIYRVYLPGADGLLGISVEDYGKQASMCTNLWIHFVHCHVREKIVITEEGNHPYPRYPDCNMFVPWVLISIHHSTNAICTWGADQKRQMMSEEEVQAVAATAFKARGRLL